jgi:hypothetical protein
MSCVFFIILASLSEFNSALGPCLICVLSCLSCDLKTASRILKFLRFIEIWGVVFISVKMILLVCVLPISWGVG